MPTSVVGNIKNLATGSVTSSSNAFIRLWLRGTRGNTPRVTGTGAIAPQVQGSLWYVDLPANGSGNVSGTVYSTRDAAGTGNGDIEVSGSYTAVWYGMVVYSDGIPGPEVPIHAKQGATLDISSITPISTPPVEVAPNGDNTYLQLTGGNGPITGLLQTAGGFKNVTAGNFTAGQMNETAQSLVNGIDPLTEYHIPQGAIECTDALTGGVSVPNGATVFQANALAGYANTASTTPNTVGCYAQAISKVNGGKVWGANFLAQEMPVGVSGSIVKGVEVDVNMYSTSANGQGVQVAGTFMAQPTGNNMPGFQVATPGGTGRWTTGLTVNDASVVNGSAISLGAKDSGNNSASQSILFNSKDSGGTGQTSSVNADANGALQLTPAAGQPVKVANLAGTGMEVTGYLQSPIFRSNNANPASTGQIRFAKSDAIAFRNEANSADLLIGRNSSDEITLPKLHASSTVAADGGLKAGASGTPITQILVYTPSLTPASVSGGAVAEQTFAVSGLTTSDIVIVNPPGMPTSTGIAGARVSAADTLAIRFVNPTAGALTPDAGVYTVLAFRH